MAKDEAEVVWEGDSLEVLRSFPKEIRKELGADIQRLQFGKRPLDYRPMKSIGQGVFELRGRDQNGWYRVVYLSRVDDRVYMLHSFVKKSAKTSRKDLSIAEARLKSVRAKLREEKKHGRKDK